MDALVERPPVITIEDVLRVQGADPERIRTRNPDIWSTTRRAIEYGTALLEKSAVRRKFRVTGLLHQKVLLEGRHTLSGPLVSRYFSNAREVWIVACTIGPRLEEAVSTFYESDPVFACALDSFGTLSIEALIVDECKQIEAIAASQGFKSTMPLCPGMEGWPLDVGQRQLFQALNLRGSTITLTDSYQMLPRKSASMAIGVGPDVDADSRPCDLCSVRLTCKHRESYAGA
jgi:hypothetical protein